MIRIAFLALIALVTAQAQIAVRVQLPDATLDVADGGTIPFVATGLARPVAANLTVTNRGTQAATINFVQISGSADFALSGVPETPAVLASGQVMGATVAYAASTSNRVTGQLRINYTIGTATSTTTLNLVGTAPEFVFSYTPQGGNATTLTSGATLQFPNTAVDAQSTALVVVANRGTAPGIFNGAAVTGAEFQTVGVPLPNTSVDGGKDVRFTIAFTPKQLDPVQGTLTIDTGDRRATFNLAGAGTGARYSYEVVTPEGTRPLSPGQPIQVPSAQLNDKTSVAIRFRNSGNAEGRITTLSVAGTGFSLSEAPLLPLTVPVGQTVAFTVNFQPTTPGRAQGRLRVGQDDFDLVSTGLGATTTYAYVVNGVSTPVTAGGSVIFTPASVGASSKLTFVLSNTGTAATTISSIGLAAPSTVFTLGTLPALPLKLEPGADSSFEVTFAPSALGANTATLRVDNQSFTLSGAGNAPPPLPTITFDGASGAQQAMQQPAIGLTLARAYPLAVTGTLTLTFNSDVFATDPSVQFATGGRTVTFTIPANTTRAIFPNNANQIRVQTGSVAGTITLTPSVSTTDAGINLTPTAPPAAILTVAAAAPRVLSAVVSAKTANSITLLISGYATSRSVTSMDLTFTATSGENVQTQKVTVPLESAFIGYYQGTTSAQYGSLFTITVPLTFAGDIKSVTQLSDTITSIGVTLTNALGTSASTSVATR
ncbi:MAG: choice-of-anchor D domain-containing protein [Bryobacterales bacterium]|nr:choice-of-anchor D domain-containing protein [Bryobacterales bacterium]